MPPAGSASRSCAARFARMIVKSLSWMVIISVIVLKVSSQSWADCSLICSARAFSLNAAFLSGLTTRPQKTGMMTMVRTTASRSALTGSGAAGKRAASMNRTIICAIKMDAIIMPARRKGEANKPLSRRSWVFMVRSPVVFYGAGSVVRYGHCVMMLRDDHKRGIYGLRTFKPRA